VLLPKAFLGASLLFAGVMLASCSMVAKEPKPDGAVKKEAQQINEIKTLLYTIQKDLEAQKIALKAVEKRVNLLDGQGKPDSTLLLPHPEEKSTISYTEPALLYSKARGKLLEEKFNEAAELFKAFVIQHPDNRLANNALYWLGECNYSQKEFSKAIGIFNELVNRYPKGEKVPDALLKTAYAYLKLHNTERAHDYLKLVVKRYPFTPAGEKAEQKLKSFQ